MRVLHVIPAIAPRYGGPSAAVGPMCRALSERGVEPLILSTNADGPGRLTVPIAERTTWQGVPALFFERDFSESFKYSRGLARWTRGHIAGFEVVHIHGVLSHACLSAAAACRRAGVPYVLRPLGTLAPWSLGQKSVKKRIMLALGARRALREAGAIHCTSDEERRGIELTVPDAFSVVIPIGIHSTFLDAREVAWSERERDRYVLVVSRLHRKKNLEGLIEAFVDMTTGANLSWRLVIAGTGEPEYVASLQRLVQKRSVAERVTFAGWVEGEQKQQLIRHASLFALVSLHENFGVSLLEALASGVPALVSRQVDLAAAVGSATAGWIVDTDVQSLRAGLSEALVNGAERSARGAAARILARQFAWPRISGQLVDLYESLLDRPHLPVASAELSVQQLQES